MDKKSIEFNPIGKIYNITMDVYIRPVNMENLEDFVFFPYRLYRDHKNWVPPLFPTRRRMLDTRHNTFLRGHEHTAFMAYRHNLPVGCITCGIEELSGEEGTSAFFCMFEAEDEEAAVKLFERAQQYAAEKEARWLWGPCSPDGSAVGEGLLMETPTEPHGMTPYNPPEYNQYTEAFGLLKYQDKVTYSFDLEKIRIDKIEGKKESDLAVSSKRLYRDFEKTGELSKILGISKDEIKPFLDKVILYHDENGLACTFPDISTALIGAHGRSMALGRKAKDTIKTLAMAQVIQAESDLAYINAIGRLLDMAKEAGYLRMITAPVPPDDANMATAVNKYGGIRLNTYRTYMKELTTS